MLRRTLPVILAGVMCALLAGATRSAEAPYEKEMLRLAEVLGSVHYLRNLCADDGEKWRDEMRALLESERPSPERRAALVSRFNRGYRAYRSSYETCTDSALEAIRRYMKEGEELSNEIASRYGN